MTVHRLRRKLEDDPSRPSLLHTIPGVGVLLKAIHRPRRLKPSELARAWVCPRWWRRGSRGCIPDCGAPSRSAGSRSAAGNTRPAAQSRRRAARRALPVPRRTRPPALAGCRMRGARLLGRSPRRRRTQSPLSGVAECDVARGTTVTWRNVDAEGEAHTVTSDPGQSVKFGSDWLLPDESFQYQLTERGRYAYYCLAHGEPANRD